jgi:carbonic anhydrase
VLTITEATTPEQIDVTRQLVREYTDWAFAMTDESFSAPAFAGLERELAHLPGAFAPPDGRLLLAEIDGHAIGCIALRRFDETTGEVKRLYVRPGHRGQHVGERLVRALISAAREAGYQRLVLDSHAMMTHAHALYRAAGFRDMAPPSSLPNELRSVVLFMEMDLR